VKGYWLKDVVMDETGQYQYLSTGKSGIYHSIDYGDHWSLLPNSLSGDWRDLVCSRPSCQTLYAANYRQLPETDDVEGELAVAAVYKSIDAGETWTKTNTPKGEGWSGMTMDMTGNKVTVGLDGAPFYQTIDGGKTWSRYGWDSDNNESWSDRVADFFIGFAIGCILLIPIIICCKMRKNLSRQRDLIRNLEQQQRSLQRTIDNAMMDDGESEPVVAAVELSPMRIGDSDVESIPSVTAIVLGPVTTTATTPTTVVFCDSEEDRHYDEKDKLLPSS
jgi:hypothetical protein